MTGQEIVIRVACYAAIGLALGWGVWNRNPELKSEPGLVQFSMVIWPLTMLLEAYWWAEKKITKK